MEDVTLTCQIISATWGGVPVPSGKLVLETLHARVDGKIISKQSNATIDRGGVANFPCNTVGIQDANIDGIPQTVQQMQLGIVVNYHTFWVPRRKLSPVFTWKQTDDGHFEWIEGPTIH